jgi:Zn-dependent M28 family amino/carboxypeptidase
MLNLNYDMLASPNFVRFVYDGDSPDTPPGSAEIETVFNDYFASKGPATEPTPLDGRSDYFLFIAFGVPAGGLFSGAEGIKTAEEAVIFGGVPGEAFDRCYHQACDTLSNLNDTALDQMSDAGATALVLYALTKDPVRTTTLGKEAAHAALNKQEHRGPRLQR